MLLAEARNEFRLLLNCAIPEKDCGPRQKLSVAQNCLQMRSVVAGFLDARRGAQRPIAVARLPSNNSFSRQASDQALRTGGRGNLSLDDAAANGGGCGHLLTDGCLFSSCGTCPRPR